MCSSGMISLATSGVSTSMKPALVEELAQLAQQRARCSSTASDALGAKSSLLERNAIIARIAATYSRRLGDRDRGYQSKQALRVYTPLVCRGANSDGDTACPGNSGGIGQLSMSQIARSNSPSSTDTAESAQMQAAHASTSRARSLGATCASSRRASSSCADAARLSRQQPHRHFAQMLARRPGTPRRRRAGWRGRASRAAPKSARPSCCKP